MTTEIKGGLLAQGSDSAAARVLRAARERIARGWCQGTSVQYRDGTEVAWCLTGSIQPEHIRAADTGDCAACRALGLVHRLTVEGVARWNDKPERTQAEVLALLDRAIPLAEGNAAEPPPGPAAAAPQETP